MESGLPDDNFERSISEVEGRNLNKLVQKDLKQNNNFIMNGGFKDMDDNIISPKKPVMVEDTNTNTVGSKILGIINNNDIKLTENISSENVIDNKINNALQDLDKSETSVNNFNNNDEKIQKIINHLDESETSISHNKNDKFQEVFSNSITKDIKNNQTFIPENGINKNKAKFFANYLNL